MRAVKLITAALFVLISVWLRAQEQSPAPNGLSESATQEIRLEGFSLQLSLPPNFKPITLIADDLSKAYVAMKEANGLLPEYTGDKEKEMAKRLKLLAVDCSSASCDKPCATVTLLTVMSFESEMPLKKFIEAHSLYLVLYDSSVHQPLRTDDIKLSLGSASRAEYQQDVRLLNHRSSTVSVTEYLFVHGKYAFCLQFVDLETSKRKNSPQYESIANSVRFIPAITQQTPMKINSQEAFYKFTTYYYQDPHPEVVASAIGFMQSAGFPQKDSQVAPLLGFFAEVFASNHDMLSGWKEEIAKTSGDTRKTLDLAMQYALEPERLIQFDPASANPAMNDLCWGAFFASGKQRYVIALLDRLAYLSERKSLMLYMTASSAQWSLSSNARQHPIVKQFLEKAVATVPTSVGKAIEEALLRNPEDIQNDTVQVVREQHEKKVW